MILIEETKHRQKPSENSPWQSYVRAELSATDQEWQTALPLQAASWISFLHNLVPISNPTHNRKRYILQADFRILKEVKI